MRNFRYISDTKLDMLSAQIPHDLRHKIAAELSINVQVFSLTLREKPTDETRYSKLDVVVSYIEKHEIVGTVEKPGAYFKGSLPMYWGPIGEEQQDIVYFGTNLPDLTLGLMGSREHTIGGAGQPAGNISPSIGPMILQSIDVEIPSLTGVPATLEERYQHFGSIMDYINEELEQDRLPENLEFLAIRLLRWPTDSEGSTEGARGGPDQQKPFLLGSPIYVASAAS